MPSSHLSHPSPPAVADGVFRPRPGLVIGLLLLSVLAGLPALQRVDLLSLLAWGGVTLVGLIGLGFAGRGRIEAEAFAPHGTGDLDTPGLKPLLQALLPVWRTQVTLAREHTEEAAGTLVHDLSALTSQFDAAGFGGDAGSGSAVGGRTQELLGECENKLRPVLQSMGEIADSHKEVAGSFRGMMTVTDELRGMADEVARIAQQTNLLAINAAVEAARAGEAGRGFSVVAAEVRRLSQDSADTARRIAQRIEQVTSMMSSTSAAAVQSAERDALSMATTGVRVEEVLGHVHELGEGSQQLIAQGQAIRSSIESLVVGLQFQDRVSQMIGAIEQDMARLGAAVDAGEVPAPQSEWLQRLEQAYTMRDQRQHHGRGTHAAGRTAAAAPQAVFF